MAGTVDRIEDVSAAAQRAAAQEPLAAATTEWLATLPNGLRPHALPRRFPHMANALAQRWSNPTAVRDYLDRLLIDTRGNRQGLPLDVADELATLKDYFDTVLHPVPQTVWDEVAARKRTQ